VMRREESVPYPAVIRHPGTFRNNLAGFSVSPKWRNVHQEESFPLSPLRCHHNKRTSINETNKNSNIEKKILKSKQREKFYANRSQKKAEVLYFYHTK